MRRRNDDAAGVLSEGRRINSLGEVKFICQSDDAITPRSIPLHNDGRSHRPVIFALTVIVEISSAEVRADNQQDAISNPQFLCVIPEEIQCISQVGVEDFVLCVVIFVSVKVIKCYVC